MCCGEQKDHQIRIKTCKLIGNEVNDSTEQQLKGVGTPKRKMTLSNKVTFIEDSTQSTRVLHCCISLLMGMARESAVFKNEQMMERNGVELSGSEQQS